MPPFNLLGCLRVCVGPTDAQLERECDRGRRRHFSRKMKKSESGTGRAKESSPVRVEGRGGVLVFSLPSLPDVASAPKCKLNCANNNRRSPDRTERDSGNGMGTTIEREWTETEEASPATVMTLCHDVPAQFVSAKDISFSLAPWDTRWKDGVDSTYYCS